MATISAGDIDLTTSFSSTPTGTLAKLGYPEKLFFEFSQNSFAEATVIDQSPQYTGAAKPSEHPVGSDFAYFDYTEDDFYNIYLDLPSSITNTTDTTSSLELDLNGVLLAHFDYNIPLLDLPVNFGYIFLIENCPTPTYPGQFKVYPPLDLNDNTYRSFGLDGTKHIWINNHIAKDRSKQYFELNYQADTNGLKEPFPLTTASPHSYVTFDDSALIPKQRFKLIFDYASGWDGKFNSGSTYELGLYIRVDAVQQFAFGVETFDIKQTRSGTGTTASPTLGTTVASAVSFSTESELTRAFVGSTTYPLSTAFTTNLNTLQQTHQENSDQFDISTSFNQTALGGFLLESSADIDTAIDLTNTGPAGIVFAGESALDLAFSSTFSGVIATTGGSDTAFDTTVTLDPNNTGVLHTTPGVISTAITLENTGLAGRIRTGFTIDPTAQLDVADLANNQVFLLQQPPDNFVYTTPGYTRTITIPLQSENQANERVLYVDQQTRIIKIPLQGEDRAHERNLYVDSETRTIPAEALDQ